MEETKNEQNWIVKERRRRSYEMNWNERITDIWFIRVAADQGDQMSL
jgi:hypothetical protein